MASNMANVTHFGIQSGTENTLYAAWTWDKQNTENYEVRWWYATGDGVAFGPQESTTEFKNSTYTFPDNATKVWFHVRPMAKKRNVNGKETAYWTATWSTAKYFYKENLPPVTPTSAPEVKIENFNLISTVTGLEESRANVVQFQIVRDNTKVYKTEKVPISTGYASFSCTVAAGSEYKVRHRTVRYNDKSKTTEVSEWGPYSSNAKTKPYAPYDLWIRSEGVSESGKYEVYLQWPVSKTAEYYKIQYTTDIRYFDDSSMVTETQTDWAVDHWTLTDFEQGDEYFFRIKAVNEVGESDWSSTIVSLRVGEPPNPPTTWSSTTKAVIGRDPVIFYWIHNPKDGSTERWAEVEVRKNDGERITVQIPKSQDPEDKNKTSSCRYVIDSLAPGNPEDFVDKEAREDDVIKWRVRTKGASETWGEWSVQRTVDVYSPPTLELRVTNSKGEDIDTVTSFPLYISATAEPATQKPLSYHLTIANDNLHTTVDELGNEKTVTPGEIIYSQYFDINDSLDIQLFPGDINLDNNVSYTVRCAVAMDSGLTANSVCGFDVAWQEEYYSPNAEIGLNDDNISVYICPYCEDDDGNLVENTLLSIYRREFDGTFVKIMTDIPNNRYTYVTDPHPSLDYARYRIVATSTKTGAVSYYDMPGYPVNEKAIILQWDEDWTNFETTTEDILSNQPWSGSLLKLPYNIDVSNSYSPDVTAIKYIGRRHPVSYYGTHVGETATWNVEIEANDEETLYALRRLSIWMGDVYVREPSGTGYWANVNVSFSQKHCGLTIPVTLNITRVEGEDEGQIRIKQQLSSSIL